jgi:hypothetical protein
VREDADLEARDRPDLLAGERDDEQADFGEERTMPSTSVGLEGGGEQLGELGLASSTRLGRRRRREPLLEGRSRPLASIRSSSS